MDAIDKYYLVSELFNDDLAKVIKAMKHEGIPTRPSRIYRDLTEYATCDCLKKYIITFDKIIKKYSGGTLC